MREQFQRRKVRRPSPISDDEASAAGAASCERRPEPLREQIIEPNLPVQFTLDAGGMGMEYESRIESATKDTMSLAAPLKGAERIQNPVGAKLRVRFARREPAVQGRYCFQSRIVSQSETPISRIMVKYPAQIHHIQERSSFRFRTCLSVLYWQELQGGGFAPLKKATTLNVSKDGLLMIPTGNKKEKFAEGSELEFAFLVGPRRIAGRGRVVRLPQVSWNRGKTQGMGIEFLDLHQRDRDAIEHRMFSDAGEAPHGPVRVFPRNRRRRRL